MGRYTMTVPAASSTQIDNDNSNEMQVNFWLHAGSTYTGGTINDDALDSVTNANRAAGIGSIFASTDNTLEITGIQLEVGSQATPFEHRSFGEELELCHRYFEKRNVDTANYELLADSGTWISTSAWQCPVRFKKVMRTAPTITNGGTLQVALRNSPNNITSFNVADNHHGRSALLYGDTATVSVSAGESTRMQSNNLNAYIQFDAEM